jgi:hypothetical protein
MSRRNEEQKEVYRRLFAQPVVLLDDEEGAM